VFKRINFTLCVSLLLPSIIACGNVATPTNAVTVLPKECRLLVNEQMPLALDGLVPPNAVISWEANAGSIISAPPGLNALFVAPAEPALILISVSISSGTPSVQIPVTRECIVTSLTDEAGVTTNVSDIPVPSAAVEVIPATGDAQSTVIISEVMANPCGPVDVRKWNEYVELYNYGDQPVDISGWWLADLGEAGTPELLIPWSQRNPNSPLAGNPILNSTIIPARGFAVILSPIYAEGTFPNTMPYQFPQNTVILTPAESRTLGDDFFSIIGDGQGRDVLVLYKGGPSVVQEVVSTYGTPKLDSYVTGIRDDYLDNLPLDLHECSSAERINPTGLDTFDNWREIVNGSPGEAPYP
jgi:hypothetical protein